MDALCGSNRAENRRTGSVCRGLFSSVDEFEVLAAGWWIYLYVNLSPADSFGSLNKG